MFGMTPTRRNSVTLFSTLCGRGGGVLRTRLTSLLDWRARSFMNGAIRKEPNERTMVKTDSRLQSLLRLLRKLPKRTKSFWRDVIDARQRWFLTKVFWRYWLRIGRPQRAVNWRPIVIVISLARRVDRRAIQQSALSEFGTLDWKFFDAFEHSNPDVGCSQSHAEALRANVASERLLMILEDDNQFHVTFGELEPILMEFAKNSRLDVLNLGGWTVGPTLPISRRLAVTASTLHTNCYVVKQSAIRTIIDSHEKSVARLLAGEPPASAAIDVQLLHAQRNQLVFAVPRETIASQFTSYSDLRKRVSLGGPAQRPSRAQRY